jgi:transposase-like protein
MDDYKVDTRGCRRAAKHKQKRVILTALGLWPDDCWAIVYWQVAVTENAMAWNAFPGKLYTKGITEETPQLVVSDGAKGIDSTLDRHL